MNFKMMEHIFKLKIGKIKNIIMSKELEITKPKTSTIIQLMTEVPYKVVAIHDFLYTPCMPAILFGINDKRHFIDEMSDKIDEYGNITRYIRFK